MFPFRLVSFDKGNAAFGVEALRRREDRGASGWRQDDVFMAYLGLAEEAREAVVERSSRARCVRGSSSTWPSPPSRGAGTS